MSYTKNSITLYLRPQAAIPAYQVNNCATWLVKRGDFKTYLDAKMWLVNQEQNSPWNYRAIMSEYFEANDYQSDYKSHRDVNKYRSSASNYYGEEPHMWYSASYTPEQIKEQLLSGIREWPAKNAADKLRVPPSRKNPKNAPLIMISPAKVAYTDNQSIVGYLNVFNN